MLLLNKKMTLIIIIDMMIGLLLKRFTSGVLHFISTTTTCI